MPFYGKNLNPPPFCEIFENSKPLFIKTNWTADHCYLTFVNLLLIWMLYFHIWCQNKGKILVWIEYYNQFGIHQCFRVSFLEPQQNNLSKPVAYSEPCQPFKIECFAKIVSGQRLLTFFVKHSILDVWQGSQYASVICHSLFGIIEYANKIDSVAKKIYSF